MDLKKPQKRTVACKKVFLRAFESCCSVRGAAKAAQVTERTHYRWLRADPSYAAAYELSRRIAAEDLESRLYERAKDGWNEVVYYQGEACGKVKRFSDGVGMFLLRGMMPEKYGIQRQEVSGPAGAPMQAKIEVVFVRPGDPTSL